MKKKVFAAFLTMTFALSLSYHWGDLSVRAQAQPSVAEKAPSENTSAEEAALPEGVEEMDISIPVAGHEDWSLPGTLTLPEGEGPFPAVVLVHGSGPSDRDETIGAIKPFRDIAWELAQKGIAVYRYDKRTFVYNAQIAADQALTLYEETVEDAVSAAQLLKEHENIDPERIFIAGHSLGGQALPRIDAAMKQQGGPAAGYIFLAAPARQLVTLMREQYDFLYSLTPELNAMEQMQKSLAYAGLEKVEDADSLPEDTPVMGAYKAYWKDLADYDQVEMAKDMTAECLVLQGEEDYQVTMEDFGIWQEAFGKSQNWKFQSYSGLTHLFTEGKRENASADYLKERSVDSRVIEDMAEFVLNAES